MLSVRENLDRINVVQLEARSKEVRDKASNIWI